MSANFPTQVFIGVAQDVRTGDPVTERDLREPFDQVFEDLVSEHLTVAPVGGPEDAVESVGIGALDGAHGVRERRADVSRSLTDIFPVATLWDTETVPFREVHRVGISVHRRGRRRLLVRHVADPLEEEQRQDVRLPVRPIDGTAAQDPGAIPEMRLEFLKT